jgi:hypothetical protein
VPISALKTRVAIDIRTISAVNKKDEQKHVWVSSAFRPRKQRARNPLTTTDAQQSLRCSMRDHQIIPDIEAPPIAVSKIRFGGRSVFGFLKPSHFFDLPATRSELLRHQVRYRFDFGRQSEVPTEKS